VVHFIQSEDAAKRDIPLLLSGGKIEPPFANDVGTHNFQDVPRAVIFGRAFNVDQVKEVHAVGSGKAKHPVAWVYGDPVKTAAMDGPPKPDQRQSYGQSAGGNVKEVLASWKADDGEMDPLIAW
jgi:hypothetical protein